MVLVKDVVNRDLYFVEAWQTVADVTKKMAELGIGAIVVLEEGRLRGVFSERDLLTRIVVGKLDPEITGVADVMTTDVAVIDESAPIEVAMESMRANRCRHLPVLCGDKVIGLISMRDLMHQELARKTEELHRIRAYVHGIA